MIAACLNDIQSKNYLEEMGIKSVNFDHYFKGKSALGSLVETCVKFVKKLIFSTIGKNILNLWDFEIIINKTIFLINKRPVAFKDALRDTSGGEVPEPITPELLVKGYDLPCVNILPSLNSADPDWNPSNKVTSFGEDFVKLQTVKDNLIKLYHEEFLTNLIKQAVDVKDRYAPAHHEQIHPGDIVLIKDEFTKRYNYPLGRILSVVRNELGETTGAIVVKGNNREKVRRHSNTLIPLLKINDAISDDDKLDLVPVKTVKQQRKAACIGALKTKNILSNLT